MYYRKPSSGRRQILFTIYTWTSAFIIYTEPSRQKRNTVNLCTTGHLPCGGGGHLEQGGEEQIALLCLLNLHNFTIH